jgi:uncharacterized damage-inducible protein DinB
LLRYDIQVLPLLAELFDHQAWADAAILAAIRACPAAMDDEKIHHTLHHIVMVQRAFLSIFLKQPFDMAAESEPPESFEALVAQRARRAPQNGLRTASRRAPFCASSLVERFRATQPEELAFVKSLDEPALQRIIETPWIPGAKLTLGQTLMQVVMHSQSHRGQCASRLRASGGQPPTLDFILWLKDRPAPAWS